jgi:hypothetical protein
MALVAVLVVFPTVANAQHRGGHRSGGGGRGGAVIYGGAPFWGPGFYGSGPGWYGFDPYFYYPGLVPYGRVDDGRSSLRLQVSPRQAEVFVDGYRAGTVDDYDGFGQRLQLPPGGHRIEIYLAGYRTVSEALLFSPGHDHKIKLTMEPLAPGEAAPPRPGPTRRNPDSK